MKSFNQVFNETVQEYSGWQNALANNDMLRTAVDLLKKLDKIEPNSESFIVGGAVRDLLLGQDPHDVDIATSIDMDVIDRHFKTDEIGKSKDFGILNVHHGDYSFEVAHFREDIGSTDSRHPDSVNLTKTFSQDAARRDYTINALGIDSKGFIHDHTGGIEDLANNVIRAVGEPAKRLQEDSLRILRAIRFAAKFGFKIEPETEKAIIELKDNITKAAPERIKDELWKVASISGSALADYFNRLDKVGLLELILPELKVLQTKLHNPKWHPEGASEVEQPDGTKKTQRGTVYFHIMAALRQSKSSDPVINISIALHDVAKAITEGEDEEGEPTYHGHEGKSVEIIQEIAKRLKFSNDELIAILFAAQNHMHKFPEMKKSKVLNVRQNPNWPVLKHTMYADKSSRLHKFDSARFDSDMDYVEDIFNKFGETDKFEKKMSSFIDGRMIMSLVDGIKGIAVGEIKDATREMIIARDFEVTEDEVKGFIIAKGREMGYKV